jgi:hypothetical protein
LKTREWIRGFSVTFGSVAIIGNIPLTPDEVPFHRDERNRTFLEEVRDAPHIILTG